MKYVLVAVLGGKVEQNMIGRISTSIPVDKTSDFYDYTLITNLMH
jgi:hypothetical protein